MSAPAPQTSAERTALKVAQDALASRDVAYGIPDAIVGALHERGLLIDPEIAEELRQLRERIGRAERAVDEFDRVQGAITELVAKSGAEGLIDVGDLAVAIGMELDGLYAPTGQAPGRPDGTDVAPSEQVAKECAWLRDRVAELESATTDAERSIVRKALTSGIAWAEQRATRAAGERS
ncbi:hypothetical protein [Actinacidiphila glaucinigra]|uniref:hypothetical protein n=1 Tax=Actinacidiphila glaucinigra TaxID=235986 RepID=UPI0035E01D15